MRFDPFMLRGRPQQTVDALNGMLEKLERMDSQIAVMSKDRKHVIIIGEGHPIDPDTGKPYPFGIRKYRIEGDRLELEHDYE